MSFPAILLLAIGLAMDVAAAAAARGMALRHIRLRQVLLVAGLFGGFHVLMPIAGWFIGAGIGPLVQSWDHWIACALLVFLGGKMLHEAFTSGPEARAATAGRNLRLRNLLLLSVATSIDALAAGITLPMLDAPLLESIITIGITTALMSAGGLYAGQRFGALLGRRLDIAGGLILIGLGVKILVEHEYLARIAT